MNEDQERKLKRVTAKIDEGLTQLQKESERELQMAVDNAERRERQIIREWLRTQWKKSPSALHRNAYERAIAFLAGREATLNEKRNRQANTQRVRDAVFKGGKR